MNPIPLPMSHGELVKAFKELREDYLKTKLRLDRLVEMYDRHFHYTYETETSMPHVPQKLFEHHKPLKE